MRSDEEHPPKKSRCVDSEGSTTWRRSAIDQGRNEQEINCGLLALDIALRGGLLYADRYFTFLDARDIEITAVLATNRVVARIGDLVDQAYLCRKRGDFEALAELVTARRECVGLRNAYTVEVWRRRMAVGAILLRGCAVCGEMAWVVCAHCRARCGNDYQVLRLCSFCDAYYGGGQLCMPRIDDDGEGHRFDVDAAANQPCGRIMRKLVRMLPPDTLLVESGAYKGAATSTRP